jgi:purine-nucleoside/S-methyl-5'-thioadenosine phosphorylase / adenosine deaminase
VSPRARAAPALLEVRVGRARAWCTGKADGNVADHVGDDPANVARNRAAVAARTGSAEPRAWVWPRQVHGAGVYVATGAPEPATVPVADAAVTAVRGLALAIVTADCAPLVVACDDAVGVVHAGHRGLAAGVVEAAIAHLRAIGTGEVRAFLGPCIRPARYEFGPHDLARLVAQFGPSVEGRTRDGSPALDLPAAIRVALERSGVVAFDDCGVCTAESDRYFSYRANGDTGRQATIAILP